MLKRKSSLCALLALLISMPLFAQSGSPVPGGPTINRPPYILRFIQDAEGALLLQMVTRKKYNHGGYKIDYKKTGTDKEISITIEGVSITDGMHTQAFAPARGSITLPTDKGDYTVTFLDKGISNKLKLSVSDESIQLDGENGDALFGTVKLSFNILPENVFSVMIIKRSNMTGNDLTQEILNAVSKLPGVEKWEPQPGMYLCKRWQNPHRFLTYFRMKGTLDWDALHEFASRYKSQAHMAITISDPKEGRQLKNQ